MQILGVRIDNLTKNETLERIGNFLDEPKFHQVSTVNPEFILEAQKNTEFRQILHRSDLNIADGIGIKWAFLRYGQWLKARFSGADLLDEILKMAESRKMGVFLAINKDGLSSYEEIKNALLKKYPYLKINGENFNPSCHSGLDPESRKILKQAQDDKNNPKILFVNFGAPLQEKFINSQRNDIIRLAMGVGGSFDFLAGKMRRAPKWMRKIGLEWLFRFALEPRYRFKRIFRAVIIFPVKIVLNK